MSATYLPLPSPLNQYSDNNRVTNYFKQMHEKIVELQNRIEALENP